jgi:hypothetical protein
MGVHLIVVYLMGVHLIGNRYPPYLDAIKSALRRHQRLKKLVWFNLSEGPLLTLKPVIRITPSLGDL